MANVIYNGYKAKIGTINWAGTTDFKVMLVDDTYTPDIDTHKNLSDVTGEISGTGYTAGGETLANRVITEDDVNDLSKFSADDVTWSDADFTIRGAIVYLDTGTASTSTLVCYLDFGGNQTISDVDFQIKWSADGVYKLA